MSQGDFDRLGSTIVDLGNNSATTEAEIADMSLRLAGAASQAGMTEADILGIAATMSELGIESEAGGSAMTRTWVEIGQEVENQGPKLETFAEIAGMAPAAFANAWKDDAAGAFGEFISGLGDIAAEGGNVNGVLEDLGITELRQADAIRRLAQGGGRLTDQLGNANAAWGENTALVDENAKRLETTEAKIDSAKNALNVLAIEIGGNVLPALGDAAVALTEFFDKEPPAWMTAGGDVETWADALAQFGEQFFGGAEITPSFDLSNLKPDKVMPAMGFGADGTWQEIFRIEPEVDWSRVEAGTNVLDTVNAKVEESAAVWNGLAVPDPDWGRIEAGTSVLEGSTVAWEDTELAAADTGEAYRSATERLQDYLDTQRAATDPVFALNKAFQDTLDTQTAYEESVQAIDDAERSLEGAHRDVEAAQRAQTEAVKEHGAGSQEAQDAAWALEEAERAVGAAERGVTEAHEATTGAAFDVAEAQAVLEDKVLSGEVSWDEYEAKLQSWVAQGDITKEQAGEMRDRIEELRAKAEETEGRYDVEMEAEVEAARDQVARLHDDALAAEGKYRMDFLADTAIARERIASLKALIGDIPSSVTTRATVQYGTQGEAAIRMPNGKKVLLHDGGWVGRDEQVGMADRLRSDEVPATLQRGEFVVNAAASRRNARVLEAINSTKMHTGGWAGGGGAGGGEAEAVASAALGEIAALLDRSGRAASDADDRIASYATTVADSGAPVDELAGRVNHLTGASDDYAGEYDGTFRAHVDDAMDRIAALRKQYGAIPRTITTTIRTRYEAAESKHESKPARAAKPEDGEIRGGKIWSTDPYTAGSHDRSWLSLSKARDIERKTGKKMAEDGSWVDPSYYSHDGGMITEQTPGWMPGLKSDERMRVLQTGEMVVARNSVSSSSSSSVDNSDRKVVNMSIHGTVAPDERLRARAMMRSL